MADKLLITSGKGGTGKSTIAVNLGVLLAKKGYRVLLIDADQGHGSLDLYLGVQNDCIYNFQDVSEGLCTIAQGLIDTEFQGLKLMSASPDEEDILFDAKVNRVLNAAFEYIIIDAPSSHSKIKELFEISDRMVIVSTCDYASIRACDRLDMMAHDAGITDTICVLNKARSDLMGENGYPTFDEVRELMKTKVVGVIPYFDKIELSANNGRPAITSCETMMLSNFVKISERIIGRRF